MREGGKLLAQIRRRLLTLAQPSSDLLDIETAARQMIIKAGALPSFALVDDYGFATCLMVNDEVIHCQPKHRILKTGDLVTIDVGLEWKGWQVDTTDSKIVGQPDDRFLTVGRLALKKAIAQAKVGNRVGHISQAMQTIIESNGYSPVRKYCGHGIGKKIHEEPQIPCCLFENVDNTPRLFDGMGLAIEIMMNEGGAEVLISSDGWSSRTADGSRSLQLEDTVLVTRSGPQVLTL